MTRRKPRHLSAEEKQLWDKVRQQAVPLRPERPAPDPAPLFEPRRSVSATSLPPFHLGEARSEAKPDLDLVPSLADRIDGQPIRMDRRGYARLKRGKLKPEARIDLHGMTLDRAHPALTQFILSCYGKGRRLVLVITGKGKTPGDDGPIPMRRGVLRHQVPHWLAGSELAHAVLQVTEAHVRHGGGGAYYVYLRRPR